MKGAIPMISYHDYMLSLLEEVDPMRAPVQKDLAEYSEARDKSEVYKETYIFRDNVQNKLVAPLLKKKATQDKLIEFTGAFIDANSTALSKAGPVMMIRFTDNETNFLYELFKTTKDEILSLFQQVKSETYFGGLSKFLVTLVENAPHKLLLVSVLIDAIQNNYSDIIECLEYLLPMCDYPMLFSHYWPTGVKEEVMEYTVEHLPNKFKLKKVSNVQGLLKWDGHSTVTYFSDKFTDGQDHWYVDTIYSLRSRMNNTFKNISTVYYANSKSGATQHKNVNQYDDGSLADNEGMTTISAKTIENTIDKFASGTINTNIIKVCAESMQVDKDNLQGFITQIYTDKTSQIPKFIEGVINAYFRKYPTSNSIQASEFIPYGLSLYRSISTSKDPVLQKINETIAHWMNDIIRIGDLYTREGTKSVYTRAIFNYFILMINYYNKHSA